MAAGLALRELGADLGVGNVSADKGREEVWVWCKSGSVYTGAEGGNERGRRELQRRSIISIQACRLQSVTVIDVGEEGDAYKKVWFVSYRLSGKLICGSLFLLLV